MKNLSIQVNVTNGSNDCNTGSNMLSSTASSANEGEYITMKYAATATATTSTPKSTCALDLDYLGTRIQHILNKNSVDEASHIVERQEKVLQQLNDLKAQIAQIRASLVGSTAKSKQEEAIINPLNNGGLREEPLHDIVINGHPNFIPYAILALKNAWENTFNIDIKTYTHSTMPETGSDVNAFEEQLKKKIVDETKPKINVTLIWKNCEHTEMISSPTMYVPIYGEINILRYFGRIGPAAYRYENSILCNEIDLVLDICYQLLRCNTSKSRATLIRALNNRLKKQKYFAGDEVSIADIGVYSSLKRMPAITEKDLTPTLLEWRKRTKLIIKI